VRSIGTFAAGAGFFFVTLALFVQGFLPAVVPASRTREVSRAVRTDLGEVKWVRYPTSDYTALEALGRRVYIREGCWYCHSQYVRPVGGEEARWGPVSEVGEYAWDQPHLLSTRRIGPDLTRVGLKYSDDWHYAHHWNPRLVVPESIMPRFPWLFERARVAVHRDGDVLTLPETPALRRLFTFDPAVEVVLAPDASGLTFVPPRPDGGLPIDGVPVVDPSGLKAGAPRLAALDLVVPTRELVGLVRYLQKLGTGRGVWRDDFAGGAGSAPPARGSAPPAREAALPAREAEDEALRQRGRAVYARRCVGCHGADGDGNGPAATFLTPRPRDFTAGVFKFRSTPSGALPTDDDLFRTVSRGIRWTAMPPWHELPAADRRAAIAFIKTFSDRWKERPEPAVALGPPPAPSPALLSRGQELYVQAKCAECHGETGRGDGPSAGQLKDDFGHAIRPTDLARGQFKGGATVTDLYRTMTVGLDGTPMPSFADSMTDEERWAISYHVLSLSAWKDPLTGAGLDLSAEARRALNDGALRAASPAEAWDPAGGTRPREARSRRFGGGR
jgi:cytochrome c oxidase cbb3-type subunit I/II